MGKITILEETTKNPITLIGKRAGICYGTDVTDDEKNYKRGMDCIISQHGRTLEFVNVELVLDGYSGRVMREYMRHVGGGLTCLQASTRYIDYAKKGFEYITPSSIKKNEETQKIWDSLMTTINDVLLHLETEYGISREDTANGLPLGMTTKVVDKKNLRNLVDMSHQRMCTRAYWEYRELFNDLIKALSEYSEEWKWICENLFQRKCEFLGYCPEKKNCGYYAKKIQLSKSKLSDYVKKD